MRVPRIFTSQRLSRKAVIALDPQSSRHLARVLRKKVGDAVIVFDGEGGEYQATIEDIDKQRVLVQATQWMQDDLEAPLAIHLGIGLSRGERMDVVMQKATELGVREITPLFTERSEVKLRDSRAEKKRLHWRQVTISACEQSGRNRIPVVHPPCSLAQWVDTAGADCKLVLHHRATEQAALPPPQSIALLVGPEGGLSPSEITHAEDAGFLALKLGPRVLRTETAPLAAIAILQARWGDMAF